MGKINVARCLLGGVVAGIAFFIMEGVASTLYMPQMEAALEAAGLSIEMSVAGMLMAVLISLLTGIILIFTYAAVRPRFGSGPRSAVVAVLILFLGGFLPSLVGYQMIGLFPTSLLVVWAIIGFAEMLIAAFIGGWLYREA